MLLPVLLNALKWGTVLEPMTQLMMKYALCQKLSLMRCTQETKALQRPLM